MEGGMRELSRVVEMFYMVSGVWLPVYTFVRTHGTVCLKWVHFIIYKLYLSKVD